MLRLYTYLQKRMAPELHYTWAWLWTGPTAGKACEQWLELSLSGSAAKGPGASVPGGRAGRGPSLWLLCSSEARTLLQYFLSGCRQQAQQTVLAPQELRTGAEAGEAGRTGPTAGQAPCMSTVLPCRVGRSWHQHVQELAGKALDPERQGSQLQPESVWADQSSPSGGLGIGSCQMNENVLVPTLISHKAWCDKAESCLPAAEQ